MIVNVRDIIEQRKRRLFQDGFTIVQSRKDRFDFAGRHYEETLVITRQAIFCVGGLGPYMLDRQEDDPELRRTYYVGNDDERFFLGCAYGRTQYFSAETAEKDFEAALDSLVDKGSREKAKAIAGETICKRYGYPDIVGFLDKLKEEDPGLYSEIFRRHIGWELDWRFATVLAILDVIVNERLFDKEVGETHYYGGSSK